MTSPIKQALISAALPMAATGVATALATTVGPRAWNYVQKNLLAGLSTSENTWNWTAQARQGKLRRAHGRDTILDNLRTAIINHSIVMLVGPSGCGKTALVEELTYRFLEESEDSKMYGVEVLSLDQRKVEGDPGLRGAVTNLLDGGTEKRVQNMMEYLSMLTDDGKIRILFIDEFQDLLRNNFTLFNQFKTLLARKGIRIIGTTTDMDLIQRWLSQDKDGVGLARRVEVIEVPAMKKKETRAVLERDFERISSEHTKAKFVFSKELAHVIVELSSLLSPTVVLPDRAISLLDDVCTKCVKAKQSDTVRIGVEEVKAYIAGKKSVTTESIQQKLDEYEEQKKFRKTFAETYFPREEKPPVPEDVPCETLLITCVTSPIEGEAERLGLFFNHPDSRGCLILKGPSQCLLNDIVSYWGPQTNYDIYRCDTAKLVREANTREGRVRLLKTFEKVFRQNKKAFLVLENCAPEWLGTLPPPELRPVRPHHELVSRSGLMKALQPLQKTLDSFGLSPLTEDLLKEEAPHVESVSVRPTVTATPDIIRDLLRLIESERLPSITLLGQETPVKLRDESNSIEVRPLHLQAILSWLNERFELKKHKQADTADDIKKMVLALYCLKDPSLSLSVLELAAQAVDNLALGKTPVDALLAVFKAYKRRDEVEEALAESEKFLGEKPFSVVQRAQPAIEDAQLDEPLFHFLASPKSGILSVIEKTKTRQQCYIEQIAHNLAQGKKCVWFDHRLAMSKIPSGIKGFVVQKYLENLQQADILMTDEEGLKHGTFKEIISTLKEPKKIIVFKNPSHASSAKNGDNIMHKIVEVGTRLITDQVPSLPQQSVPIEDPFFREFEKMEFVSSELSPEDLRQLFNKQLETKDLKDDLKSVIVSLYLILIKHGKEIDYILERFNSQIDQLAACDCMNVFDEFTKLYGKVLKMTLIDVKYEIDPSSTPLRYRLKRTLKGIGSRVVQVMTFAFKYLVTPFTAVGIVSTGGSWLVSRFLWRRAS